MPESLSGFPYIEAQFDKKQKPIDPNQSKKIEQWLTDENISDLIVMSHGWNNDIAEARSLYEELAGNIADQIAAGSGGGLPGRVLGMAGLLWPSKKFANEDLIPGGAADASGDLNEELVLAQIEVLRELADEDDADGTLDEMAGLVGDLEFDPEKRTAFFKAARSLLGPADELDPDDRSDIPPVFFDAETDDEIGEIFDELKKPDPPGTSTIQASDGAVAFGIGGFKAGAGRLLNLLTYYKMKKRARLTGVKAIAPMLLALRASDPDLRIHLIGHSFGGLLVTSTAWSGKDSAPAIPVTTMSLLQAAFSHNGFAKNFHKNKDGRYRSVIENSKVDGPIVITHTHNDKAVGIAYALASRLSRVDAAAVGGGAGVGDADDRFGGIGANGAQHTPEAVAGHLESPGTPYNFESGKIHNLKADDHILNHSDVRGKAVANAIVEAIASV